MALVRLPVDTADLHCVRLYDELPVAVGGRDHLISAAPEVTLDDLVDEQLVRPHASGWRPTVDQLDWPPMTEQEAIEAVAAGTGTRPRADVGGPPPPAQGRRAPGGDGPRRRPRSPWCGCATATTRRPRRSSASSRAGPPTPRAADPRPRLSGMPALVASAPGRVNLIGEHTDYNSGLCLPLALPQRTTVTLTPRDDLVLSLSSAQEDDAWEGSVDEQPTGWAAYVAGVVAMLRADGHPVPGFTARIDSEVPLGAGLSSSAALECAVAVAVAGLLDLDLDEAGRRRLADACIRAENDYVGAPTGGMDQTVAMLGRPGFALLLDFADGSVTRVALPLDDAGLALLVIDTRVSHSLTDGVVRRPSYRVRVGRRRPRRRLPPRHRPRRRGADGRPGAAPAGTPRGHREPTGPRRGRGARRRRLAVAVGDARRLTRLDARRLRDLLPRARPRRRDVPRRGGARCPDDGRWLRRVRGRPGAPRRARRASRRW